MFTVWNIFYITVPTLSTIFTLIILFCSWAAVLAICCNSTCPGPEVNRRLINHVWREPDDQVPWYFVNRDALQDLSFTRWQPVFSVWRLPAYSKNILKMFQWLDVSWVVPSKFFMRLNELYHCINPLRWFNCFKSTLQGCLYIWKSISTLQSITAMAHAARYLNQFRACYTFRSGQVISRARHLRRLRQPSNYFL